GLGNVYLTNKRSANKNMSYNRATGSAGGGGVTITMGTVYVSDSEISNNKTFGMYSGGIVSLIGDTIVTNSRIMGNTNNGQGGGIAANIGKIKLHSSTVSSNIGASLGGAIANFSPSPGIIEITGKSFVTNNILTNGQTIKQTIESFLDVIKNSTTAVSKQA